MFDSKGIIIPLVTPYDDNGKIDPSSTEKLFEHFLEKGIRSFYIGGSSGECYLQTQDERLEFLEVVARINQGRAKLMAHIGAISTPNTIELGRKAHACGYDAISSTPPFYYGFTKTQIMGFYKEIVRTVDLPMVVYNAASVTGVDFSLDELGEMLSWDNVIGLKHTTTNMTVIERLKQRFPEKLIYHGEDYMLVSGAVMGADGGIGSTYNVMPDRYLRLWKAVEDGDFVTASREQNEINSVIDVLLKPGFLAGIKGMLKLQGYDVGQPRKPFTWLSDDQWDDLKRIKDTYQL
ncbi:N-acetylneuraminate lyase [Saccharospirillum salsuginis]|uniref:N-acetylneuraminate lyase n=1 Tax=Saccharospirillum salsuginis TaxID=418750 RepID=A0A918K1X0_9GAMM|nr:N-acetylneuraminate lyase [Saccharospirillum salsuginis]GGX41771.1 N-acetylneuraminate lyase [Saccharospirillum salsuginis]